MNELDKVLTTGTTLDVEKFLGTNMNTEKVKQILEEMHPKLLNFRTISLLDVNVVDYVVPIETPYFVLIKITDIQSQFGLICDVMVEKGVKNPKYERCKFLMAHDKPEAMSWQRFSVYLHNKNIHSLETDFTSILVSEFDTAYFDIGKIGNEHSNYCLEAQKDDFDKIFRVSETPSIIDFDVQLILDSIPKDKKYLYRGINSFRINDDGIAASNYHKNPQIALFGQLQTHEKELICKLLMNKECYGSSNPVSALSDLRHLEKDTNTVDFSEDYNVSLFFACEGAKTEYPAEFLVLPKNELDTLDEANFAYPIQNDYKIYPDPLKSECQKRIETQSSVFVYCCNGFLSRKKYNGIIKNILIPFEITGLLKEYSGFTKNTIFSDLTGYMDNSENFKSSVSCLKEPNNRIKWLKKVLSFIHPAFENFNTICFLSMEIGGMGRYTEENRCHYIHDSSPQYAIYNNEPIREKYIKFLFENNLSPHFVPDDAENIDFIFGCNDQNVKEKFDIYLKNLYPNDFSDYDPFILIMDIEYGNMGNAKPKGALQKLQLKDGNEFNEIMKIKNR